MSESPGNPMTLLLNQTHPVPVVGEQPKGMDDGSWKEIRDERLENRKRVQDERKKEMATPEYQQNAVKYSEYEARIHSFAQNQFKPFCDKKPKNGWKASMSIATDGVSVSIAYERTFTVPVKDTKNEKKANKEKCSLTPCDDYDPNESTFVNNTLVLGVDPPRKDNDSDNRLHRCQR